MKWIIEVVTRLLNERFTTHKKCCKWTIDVAQKMFQIDYEMSYWSCVINIANELLMSNKKYHKWKFDDM